MQIRSRAIAPGRSYKPKPYSFPKGFVLVIDTREQRPLCMTVKGLTICRDTLRDGDYSIRGFEDRFAIERKRASDFFAYIGRERKKTLEKLRRLSQFDFAGLVVEAALDDLVSHRLFTKVHPEAVRQFLVSANVRYGIHTYLDPNPKSAERWILDRAIKFYELCREV